MKRNERMALFVGVRNDLKDEHGGPVISEIRFMQVNDGFTYALVETTRGEAEVHECQTFDSVQECEWKFIEETMCAQHTEELIQITVEGEEPDMRSFSRHIVEMLMDKIAGGKDLTLPDGFPVTMPEARREQRADESVGYGMYL